MEKRESYYTVGGNVNGATIVENSMEIPQKTNNRITIWSSNPPPGHIPRENHDSKGRICSNIHCSTLYNSQTWKQPKCPSTEVWIKKMVYIYTVKYYLPIKRKEIMAFEATWIDLETITLSEVSDTVKHQPQTLSLTREI